MHGAPGLEGEVLHGLLAAELDRRRAVLERSPIDAAGFTLRDQAHQTGVMPCCRLAVKTRDQLARVLTQRWAEQALGGGDQPLLDESPQPTWIWPTRLL